jgi:hypothetical protein
MTKLNCKIEADLWLDYIENEVSPDQKSDLKLHLDTCDICQKNCSNMKLLTHSVRDLPQMKDTMPSDLVFKKMNSKIMAQIDKTQIENVVVIRRAQVKIIFGASAAAFILVFGSVFGPSVWNHGLTSSSRSQLWLQNPEDQLMVENSQNDLEVFGNVIMSQQDSDDLVLDATAEKLSRMSDQDARAKLEQLK